ncbi:hypothetical protein ACFU3E_36780 [Streptomyces sp. NPDC057424]|uniref:hypothetical protein n=1 Tax=Streptomyces sp. NPDC057424 TaxID=3346127 RepID=UPI00367F13E4
MQSGHGLHHRTGPLQVSIAQRRQSPDDLRRCVGEDPADCAMVRAIPGAAAAGVCVAHSLIAIR